MALPAVARLFSQLRRVGVTPRISIADLLERGMDLLGLRSHQAELQIDTGDSGRRPSRNPTGSFASPRQQHPARALDALPFSDLGRGRVTYVVEVEQHQ